MSLGVDCSGVRHDMDMDEVVHRSVLICFQCRRNVVVMGSIEPDAKPMDEGSEVVGGTFVTCWSCRSDGSIEDLNKTIDGGVFQARFGPIFESVRAVLRCRCYYPSFGEWPKDIPEIVAVKIEGSELDGKFVGVVDILSVQRDFRRGYSVATVVDDELMPVSCDDFLAPSTEC